MSKEFKQPNIKYQPDTDPTDKRFLNAKKEWDQRLGTHVIQAKNWRIGFLGLLVACVVLAIGLVIQGNKSTVKPYIVEVDSKNGMVRAVGMAEQKTYVPNDAVIKFFISEFVQAARGIPADKEQAKKNWEWIYHFMSIQAGQQMTQYIKNEQVRDLNNYTKSIHVKVVVPASKKLWQARWEEITKDNATGTTTTVNMTGNFDVEIIHPKDEKDVLVNPIGLYIKNYDWGRETN